MTLSRTFQAAAVLMVASVLVTGCGNNSAQNRSAQNNVGTNRAGTSSVNQLGLPGLTHGANLRSDRNLENLVNAVPGVPTTSVLVTGNTAYVLLDAGSTTGRGNTGTGTAGTQNLTGGRKMGTGPGTGTGVNTKGPSTTNYNGVRGTGGALVGPTGTGTTNTYGGTADAGTGTTGIGTYDTRTYGTGNTGTGMDTTGSTSAYGAGTTGAAGTSGTHGAGTTGTGTTGTGVRGMGTYGGDNNTRTGANQVTRNNLPNVGTSTTQSVTPDLQTRITAAIKSGNPAIQNIYFVTRAQ